MVRQRDRADALDGEQPNVLSAVAIGYQIEPSASEPEVIGIDLAPRRLVLGSGIVTHLRGASLVDGLGDGVDGLTVLTVALVRAEADGKHLLHRPDVFVTLGRERRRRFT